MKDVMDMVMYSYMMALLVLSNIFSECYDMLKVVGMVVARFFKTVLAFVPSDQCDGFLQAWKCLGQDGSCLLLNVCPHIFCWTQIQWVSWSLQNVNFFFCKKVLDCFSAIAWGAIVHQNVA